MIALLPWEWRRESFAHAQFRRQIVHGLTPENTVRINCARLGDDARRLESSATGIFAAGGMVMGGSTHGDEIPIGNSISIMSFPGMCNDFFFGRGESAPLSKHTSAVLSALPTLSFLSELRTSDLCFRGRDTIAETFDKHPRKETNFPPSFYSG